MEFSTKHLIPTPLLLVEKKTKIGLCVMRQILYDMGPLTLVRWLLPERIQVYRSSMVFVGSDMVNLYLILEVHKEKGPHGGEGSLVVNNNTAIISPTPNDMPLLSQKVESNLTNSTCHLN